MNKKEITIRYILIVLWELLTLGNIIQFSTLGHFLFFRKEKRMLKQRVMTGAGLTCGIP